MHALNPLRCTRIVSTADALDRVVWPAGVPVCRLAADEVLLLDDGEHLSIAIDDPHAIRRVDTAWAGMTMREEDARVWLAGAAEWAPPETTPAFVQGLVMGLPVKLWWAAGQVRVMVAAPFAADFAERLR